MRVYHLSEAHHALNNVALKRMKISRIEDLNDPFELLAVDLRDVSKRRAFRESREQLHKDNGLLCFSRSWANPVLWSHYADKHRGICLGFDVDDSLLKEVDYIDKPLKLEFKVKSGTTKLDESFAKRLLFTKFYDWSYEDELRVYVQLDHKTCEGGLYFMPFSEKMALREIILGPRCVLPIRTIRDLVSCYESDVFVMKARLAFSKFKVIENRAASRLSAQTSVPNSPSDKSVQS